MSWIKKLQEKWGLKSLLQVIIILIVFACTGSTVVFIRKPLVQFIFGDVEKTWWMQIVYIMLIFPIYNIFLLAYGFIFGQFEFFWKYEKKVLRRFGFFKNENQDTSITDSK